LFLMVHGMVSEEGSSDVLSTKALMTVISRYLRDQMMAMNDRTYV
jgi:hypothetical protein